jgi:hypothetical protein
VQPILEKVWGLEDLDSGLKRIMQGYQVQSGEEVKIF